MDIVSARKCSKNSRSPRAIRRPSVTSPTPRATISQGAPTATAGFVSKCMSPATVIKVIAAAMRTRKQNQIPEKIRVKYAIPERQTSNVPWAAPASNSILIEVWNELR